MQQKLSLKEIHKILNSPELLAFIKTRLYKIAGSEPLVLMPRKEIKSSKRKGKFKIVNNEGEEMKDEREYSDDFFSKENFKQARQDAVIVGGSLAGLINEFIYKVPAQINDVDIFFYKFDGKTHEEIGQELYENIQEEQFKYQIIKSTETGLVNKVEIFPEYDFNWECLLNSFDLDCCQVGWNLAHDSLFYTKNFANFLQERVINLRPEYEDEYPLTSYLRGQVKSQELKAKFYLGENLTEYYLNVLYDSVFKAKMDSIPLTDDKKLCENSPHMDFVTKKRLEIWRKNPNLLAPWFLFKDNKMIIGEVFKNYHWHNFFEKLALLSDSSDSSNLSRFSERIRGVYSANGEYKFYLESKATLSRCLNIVSSGLFAQKDRLWELVKDNGNIFKENYRLNDLALAEKFLQSHNIFQTFGFFLVKDYNFSIQDLLNFILTSKKQPLPLVGFLENYFTILCRQSKSYNNSSWYGHEYGRQDNITEERIKKINGFLNRKEFNQLMDYLQQEHKKDLDKDFLTDPLNLKIFNKNVKELTKNSQLVYEGQDMKHCVGGYGHKVKSGTSRIFHIQVGENKSTLELLLVKEASHKKVKEYNQYKNKTKKKNRPKNRTASSYYIIGQHRAKHNSAPYKSNEQVAKLLIRYLNGYNDKNS